MIAMENFSEKTAPLILIDAYSQIFRSFYAIRALTNSRGEPVNAAFVFTKLLLKLEKEFPSGTGAMLFDCGKVAFRSEILPEYKANRPPMPDDLRSQIPLIRKIAEAFGWQLFQYENWEADDLIGGMAEKFTSLPVRIVSSDKDLSQLVNERVAMLVPGANSFELRGRDEVMQKFGVTPELMVDYLSLLGDASDNIPGVPGIGPKSAADLLNTFGCAEDWLDAPEKIADSKYAKKLLPHLDILAKNRRLIKLKTVLPAEWDNMPVPEKKNPDWQLITEICRDNQFNSILRELPEVPLPKADVLPDDDLFAFAEMERNGEETHDLPEKNDDKSEQLELF